MLIEIDFRDKRPLYEQISDKLKRLIEEGVIGKDELLPSVRALSMELSINPNTIQKAYGVLDRDGYSYSVAGKGSFAADVSGLLPGRIAAFYGELDTVLARAPALGVGEKEVTEHVSGFFRDNAGSGRTVPQNNTGGGEEK